MRLFFYVGTRHAVSDDPKGQKYGVIFRSQRPNGHLSQASLLISAYRLSGHGVPCPYLGALFVDIIFLLLYGAVFSCVRIFFCIFAV